MIMMCTWIRGSKGRPECQACGLWRGKKTPFIPPTVEDPHRPVELAVVGEGPGLREDEAGEYFVGKAGRVLDEHLDSSAWRDANVGFFNAVQCWPGRGADGKDLKPTVEQVRCCRPLLLENLQRAKPSGIIALGQWAGRALTDDGTLTVGGKRPSRLRALDVPGWEGHPPATLTYHPAAEMHSGAPLGVLIRQDLDQFHRLVKKGPAAKKPASYQLDFERLASQFAGRTVSLDFEYGPNAELCSIAVTDGKGVWSALIQHMDADLSVGIHPWRDALNAFFKTVGVLIGHNICSDLLAAARFGCQLPPELRLIDSLTLARMTWENEPDRGLETMVMSKLGFPDYTTRIRPYKKKYGEEFPLHTPAEILLPYNEWDAWSSYWLAAKLYRQAPPVLFRVLMNAEYDLVWATHHGQKVNQKQVKKHIAKYKQASNAALKELRAITKQKEYNPNTPEGRAWPFRHLGWRGIRRGTSDVESLDQYTLKWYEQHPPNKKSTRFAKVTLAYRAAIVHERRLKNDVLANISTDDCTHAQFHTASARTLRDSSSKPNFQNIPGQLRDVFVSRWK